MCLEEQSIWSELQKVRKEEVNGCVVGPGARWVCWGLNIQLREVDFIDKYIQVWHHQTYLLDKNWGAV